MGTYSFTIGFNWWFIIIPLMLVLDFIISFYSLKLDRKALKILNVSIFRIKGIRKNWPKISGFIFTCIFAFLFCRESFVGFIQTIDNVFGKDPACAFFAAVLISSFSVMFCFRVIFSISKQTVTYRYKMLEKTKMKLTIIRMKKEERLNAIIGLRRDYPDIFQEISTSYPAIFEEILRKYPDSFPIN